MRVYLNFQSIFSILFMTSVLALSQTTNESVMESPQPSKTSKVIKFDVVDSNFESTEKIVIDAEAIQKSRSTNVAQVLANQANITIATTNFQPNSIFVRGGDSNHVLILIDDVPTYDSSTLQRTLNLSNLNISSVKRIEVLKGSQAVLYGGQAMSAVIKIYTIPSEFQSSAKVSAQLRRKLGTDSSVNFAKAATENVLVTLDARYADQVNASPVLNSTKVDGYKQQISSTQLGVSLKNSANLKTSLKLNYSNDDNEAPTTGTGGAALDIDGQKADTESIGGTLVLNANDRFLVSIANQTNVREIKESNLVGDKYEGQLTNARFDIRDGQKGLSQFQYQLGATISEEKVGRFKADVKVKDDVRQQNEGYFGKIGVRPLKNQQGNLLVEAGVRSEFSQGENGQVTSQVGITAFEDFKLEASTGSRKPSLAQRFDPSYGNPNLADEKATTYNVSYAHKLNSQSGIAVAAFDSNYKNLVGSICGRTRDSCKLFNISASRTVGGEVSANYYNEYAGQGIRGYLAYQEPKDLSSGAWLMRRPLRTAGLQLKNDWTDKFDTLLEVAHTGSRRDFSATAPTGTLVAYTVVNLTANLRVQEDLDLFGRIDNLQNKTFETTFGYYVQGAELKAGIEKRF